MSQEDPIEIVIISEKESPFKQEPSNLKNKALALVSRALKKTAQGTWFVSKKVWQSDARKKTTEAIGKQANKVWQSEARKTVTRKTGEQVGKVLEKNKVSIQKAVSTAVNERLDKEKERLTKKAKETDWKDVAKQGAVRGTRGLSNKLKQVANNLNTSASHQTDQSDS